MLAGGHLSIRLSPPTKTSRRSWLPARTRSSLNLSRHPPRNTALPAALNITTGGKRNAD